MIPADGAATAPCPFCGGETGVRFAAFDVNRRVSDRLFHVRACARCGLMFVADLPDDLACYYTGDYHAQPASAADLAPLLAGHRYKLDLLRRFRNGGELLEIGPSSGAFCLLAKEAGFSVSAIEMDASCCRFLGDVLGVRAVNSGDPAAVLRSEERTYDAICLWHSLEHLPTPWSVLEEAARKLRPDGVLLIAVPNPEAWQARVMGARWPHWDLPRHRFHMPMAWMLALGRRLGLAVRLATTRDPGSLFLNRSGWAMWLSRGGLLGWRLALGIVILTRPWERREGAGSAYVVALQRQSPGGKRTP